MYGTVMIGTLAPSATVEDIVLVFKDWRAERNVDGFVDEWTLVSDDGRTIVTPVRFRDQASYQALADDPEQDTFWTTKVMPLLSGEPQWIDGSWVEV